jgi:hypothetical protein
MVECKISVLGFVLLALAEGCAAPAVTALADLSLRSDVRVEPSVRSDVCVCPCSGTSLCIRYICGTGCRRIDRYELRVVHGPESGSSECLPGAARDLTAKLVSDDGDEVLPRDASDACGQLSFVWELPETVDVGKPHRVTIADESASWSIDDPFRRASLTIVAPPEAASPPEGAARAVRPGQSIALEVTPAMRMTNVRATLSPRAGGGVTAASLPATIDRSALAIPIGEGTSAGTFDLQVAADTDLEAAACQGPPVCRGLGVAGTWALRVE